MKINGNDSIFAGQNDDYVEGGTGDDNLIGATGSDNLVGGEGNDTLTGYDPAVNNDLQVDVLTGGGGADYFAVNGGSFINPAYSFNGANDYVWISDFSGLGYPDPLDPNNGNSGDGDQIQLLDDLQDYYVFTEGNDGISDYKDIYVNSGYLGQPEVYDLIARVSEPTGLFNPSTDIVYV